MSRWHDTDQTDYYLEYDKQGRTIKNSSPSGYWCGGFIYDDVHKMTTYFNNEGEQSYYYYNDAGLVTHAIDALGARKHTEWQNNQKLVKPTPLGKPLIIFIIMTVILRKPFCQMNVLLSTNIMSMVNLLASHLPLAMNGS
nr:hypothetical protein [Proteus mirabilis]